MKRAFLMSGLMSAAVLVGVTVAAPAASAATLRVCPTLGVGCQFTHIQDAINHASNGDTVNIAPGRYKENLTIGGASPLSLVGAGPQSVIIDGNQSGSVLTVLPGHSVRLVGLTLTNGVAPVNPAVGGRAGGGIANFGGSVEVINSRITGNSAPQGFGGGVFNTDVGGGGTLRLVTTLVSGNTAGAGGGVSTISLSAATNASLVNSTVEGNTSTGGPPALGIPAGAGGVQNCGTLSITNTPIRNNSASNGGGLTNCGNGGLPGTATLTNSPITGNHATGQGGGGPFAGSGGGVSNGGTLKLVNSPVTNNVAASNGGGIFNLPPGEQSPTGGTVTRINSPVVGNTGSPAQFAQCFGTTC